MTNRTKTDHYRDITRPELEELYYYLSNPETDTDIAMRDIAKEYGENVMNLLLSMIDH
jgi:hypothetical protein